jgi:tetratricopeptide (TPR) repeat protein
VVAVSLLLGIAASTWQAFRATRAEVEANRQRDEAQANFRKAREAVDKYFTLVSEEQLLDMPILQSFRKKLLDTALEAYQEFLSQHGDDPLVLADLAATHLRIAQIMYRMGRHEQAWLPHDRKAVDILERVIAEGRDSPEVQQRFVGVYRTEGGPVVSVEQRSTPEGRRETLRYLEKMIAAYEKFVRDNPDNEAFRNDLAGITFYAADTKGSLGQLEEAIAAGEKAIAIWEELARDNPKNPIYRVNLSDAYTSVAWIYRALGRAEGEHRAIDRSLVLTQQLAKESPANSSYQHRLAACYLQISKSSQEREKYLRESVAILDVLHRDYPTVKRYRADWARARLELAEIRHDLSGMKDALDHLDQLMALTSYDYKRRGDVYFQHKLYDKALVDMAKAVELNPDDPSNLWWINSFDVARCPDEQFRQGMLALADKTIERTGGKDGAAFVGSGSLYGAMGQYDKAIADLNRAVELGRADPGMLKDLLRFSAACSDPKLRNAMMGLADKIVERALQRTDTNPSLLNDLAWSLASPSDPRFRNTARALDLAKRAAQRKPENGAFSNTLGVAFYRAGEWKASVDALKKSMQLRQGGDSFDWFFLAMAHWQLGQKDEARKWYSKSVEWMEKENPRDDELIRFRREAEALLGVKK